MNDLISRQTTIEASEPRKETVKDILADIDAIQSETKYELRMIADAVYRGAAINAQELKEEPRNEPIIIQYARQRDTAKEILNAIIQIREELW